MKIVTKQNALTITDQHRAELAEILSIDPDGDVMKQTEVAVYRAYALANVPSTSTDLTDLKTNLKSLESGLNKIQKSFQKIQHALRYMDNAHFIDDHYCLANDGDTYLLELALAQRKDSGFEVVVGRLLNAVQDFEKESCVDAGSGNHKDTRFTNALMVLADFFEVTFPHRKLTESDGSVFGNFAKWFLKLHSGLKSPRRHIGNALEARTVRDIQPQK
jgi:hypothetical protein